MAAAWYHARSIEVNFDNVAAHIGSKSAASIRERLRLCRKKEIQIEGVTNNPTTAPAGGIDKKAAGKVNASPRKAAGPKTPKKEKSKPKSPKKEAVEDEPMDGEAEVKDEFETEESPMEEVLEEA